MMRISNNSWAGIFSAVTVLLVILIFTLVIWGRYNPGIGLGGGYRLVFDRADYVHILKDNNVVVAPAIVDYYEISHYVVGLRLPANFVSCDNGSYSTVRVKNKKMYFILDKDEDSLVDFDSKESFDHALVDLGISGRVSIQHSAHDMFWEKISSQYKYDDKNYFFNCKPNPVKLEYN
jgi:hypothetical protein